MKLHQYHDGVWIVPELVASVEIRAAYNGMCWNGYIIEATMVGGGRIELERCIIELGDPGRPDAYTSAAWIDYGQPAVRRAVAWIDERRTEPLEVVRA